jgi:hypothetical protein
MRRIVGDIASGRFPDEWGAERDSHYARLAELKQKHAGPAIRRWGRTCQASSGPVRARASPKPSQARMTIRTSEGCNAVGASGCSGAVRAGPGAGSRPSENRASGGRGRRITGFT